MTKQEMITAIEQYIQKALPMIDKDHNPSLTSRSYYLGEINAFNIALRILKEEER